MLVEFVRVLNKIEADMWTLEERKLTQEPEYYRLTGARATAIQLRDFYEKQMVEKGRIVPEGVPNEKVSPDGSVVVLLPCDSGGGDGR